MAATIVTWLVYAASSRCGRPAAAAAHVALARLRLRDPRPPRARREPLLKLSLVGISHHVAPVELRERVALPLERAASLARALGDAVCLSTCNRTELYLAGQRRRRARSVRSRSSRASRCGPSPTACTTRPPPSTSSASRPGSTRWSPARARSSARCARPSTPPRPGRCSTGSSARRSSSASACAPRPRSARARRRCPSAAAALARAGLRRPRRPARAARRRRAGSASSPPAASRRAAPRSPTSRTAAPRPPPTLAARFGAAPIALDEVAGRSSARSTSCSPRRARRGSVIAAADVPARRRQPLFFIDIAVPRDVDPAVHELDGCYLYDIDDLEAVVAETHRRPARRGRKHAEQLVAEEAERFREWQASLEVVPAITSLRALRRGDPRGGAREARRPARGRAAHARVGDGADPEQAPPPADRAHEGGRAAADGGAYAEAVRHLFGLDDGH